MPPKLQSLSQHRSSPKWSIEGRTWPNPKTDAVPGPGSYSSHLDKRTSIEMKGGPSFAGSDRFKETNDETIGPGKYRVPKDFSSRPWTSSPSFKMMSPSSKFNRSSSFSKQSNHGPDPTAYDVRNMTRSSFNSLSTKGVGMRGRYSWYYEEDVKKSKDIPELTRYDPKYDGISRFRNPSVVVFGCASRTPIYGSLNESPGPGAYNISCPRPTRGAKILAPGKSISRNSSCPDVRMISQPTSF